MSPRRKVESDERNFFDVAPKSPRRWGLPIIAALATLLIAAAITGSTLMLNATTRIKTRRPSKSSRWITCGDS